MSRVSYAETWLAVHYPRTTGLLLLTILALGLQRWS